MSDDSTNPRDLPADAVVPPPPPETPIPEGLIPEPIEIPPYSADVLPADVVIPPPPPEAMMPSRRSSRRPAVFDGDQPAAAADDWAEPSVAPEVPSSGGYGVLSAIIFILLFVLLAGAIVAAFYLGATTSFALADSLVSLGGGASPL